MKATTIILAAVLSLSINVLFASNDGATINSETHSVLNLAPTTPFEATFEETTAAVEFSSLAPNTPNEADFEEVEIVTSINLEPVTPNEADFNDEPTQIGNINSLAPVTPAVADFDELS